METSQCLQSSDPSEKGGRPLPAKAEELIVQGRAPKGVEDRLKQAQRGPVNVRGLLNQNLQGSYAGRYLKYLLNFKRSAPMLITLGERVAFGCRQSPSWMNLWSQS